MATLLMPLPDSDFDPTESGVPWRTMRDHGHRVVFATPSGRTARADPKMVTGEGLGMLSPLLKADTNGRSAYLEMEQSDAGFRRPISYGEIRAAHFPFMRIQIRAPSFQYIAKDHDFLVSDESICHDTAPEGETDPKRFPFRSQKPAGGHIGRFHGYDGAIGERGRIEGE